MKPSNLTIYVLLLIGLFISISAFAADDAFKDSALSWQKQAVDTRAVVVSVYEELTKLSDQADANAKELIDDAVIQLGEGDKKLKAADDLMTKESFEQASSDYNMAWQYYVKAATAGLNAKRIITGQ